MQRATHFCRGKTGLKISFDCLGSQHHNVLNFSHNFDVLLPSGGVHWRFQQPPLQQVLNALPLKSGFENTNAPCLPLEKWLKTKSKHLHSIHGSLLPDTTTRYLSVFMTSSTIRSTRRFDEMCIKVKNLTKFLFQSCNVVLLPVKSLRESVQLLPSKFEYSGPMDLTQVILHMVFS